MINYPDRAEIKNTPNYERHLKALKFAVKQIKASPGACYVNELYLYGSFARGDYQWNSDIDLFLSVNEECLPQHRRDLRILKGAVSEDELFAVEVDLKIVFGNEWEKSDMLYYQNVARDGIKLWY